MGLFADKKVKDELKKGANLSIINLVDGLVEEAYDSHASDIHLDPGEKNMRVRMRIDGVLLDKHELPKDIQAEIIARIKVLSGLRTDEHQTAQDGRFRSVIPEVGSLDVRVSIAPTYYGENAVLRLLTDTASQFSLESMGFEKEERGKIEDAIQKPHGMILATGPTGSGKTTTLYTIIKMLNTPQVSIVTIEDPIEYAIQDIEQIQVNSRAGLTFANGLRSILRQDPNIIMVGEIRDAETAGIAVNTALTGHLLLSTLHTNDAATTLPRLLDMKIESFLVASTVNVAIAQRLVRKICEHCKKERKITDAEKASLSEAVRSRALQAGRSFFFGEGCEKCGKTGYSGRVCINEVLVVDNEIREAILKKASAADIKHIAVKNGMTTMMEDGFRKAEAGVTTLQEVLRVAHE